MATVRLLVTCVGGFAWTEWELHHRLYRVSPCKSVMDWLQRMWWKTMRRPCFFSSTPASVILTHYIIAVALAAARASRFSLVPEACSWPARETKHVPVLLMKAAWRPLTEQTFCLTAWGEWGCYHYRFSCSDYCQRSDDNHCYFPNTINV